MRQIHPIQIIAVACLFAVAIVAGCSSDAYAGNGCALGINGGCYQQQQQLRIVQPYAVQQQIVQPQVQYFVQPQVQAVVVHPQRIVRQRVVAGHHVQQVQAVKVQRFVAPQRQVTRQRSVTRNR